MRVYGASPLYNYVELVFRSKRLFILSIVLASAIVSVLATTRAKTYTATAVIVLSQTQQVGAPTTDEVMMGSIRYKLNILSTVLKNPYFVRDALRAKDLNKDRNGATLSEVDFETLSKDVQKALSVSSAENILEITCRWKDDRAAAIVKAFYEAYSHEVLDLETAVSTTQVSLLEKLHGIYLKKQQDMEKTVARYQRDHTDQPHFEENAAALAVENQNKIVEEERLQLNIAKEQRTVVSKQLETTPKEVDVEIVHGPPMQSISDLPTAQEARTKAQEKLNDLLSRYTPSHPQVQAAQKAFDAADAKFRDLEKKGNSAPASSGPIKSFTRASNPEWARLNAQLHDQDTQIRGKEAELSRQETLLTQAKETAKTAPMRNFEFRWMTGNLQQVSSIRSNLAGKLEMAKLDEIRDRELHTAEMKMMFDPESEQELTGARSLLLYAAGPLLGIIIAFAFSLVAESLDHSLRTPVEVEKYLNKPVLAVLPRMDTPRKAQRQLGGADAARPSLPS